MGFSLFFCLSFVHLVRFVNRSKVPQAIELVVPWLFHSQTVLVTEGAEYLWPDSIGCILILRW